MIETATINVPMKVEYEIHKAEMDTGTHDEIEIHNISINNEYISWEAECAILAANQDRIEDECYDASKCTSYHKTEKGG